MVSLAKENSKGYFILFVALFILQFLYTTLRRTSMSMQHFFAPHLSKVSDNGCITLVGMAAAGKTTIGKELSMLTGWAQMDSDNLIESFYGVSLHTLTENMEKEAFLDLEGQALLTVAVKRVILSTGGSVVYRESAMEYIKSLGPVIYISVPLPIIIERIKRKPDRGLAMNPGQTIEDLYEERASLYEKYADFTVIGGEEAPSCYAKKIADWLQTK